MGQDKDLVNPCSLLAFMGSIANEGEAVVPNLVGSETIGGTAIPAALPDGKDTYETYSAETCQRLKEMMRNNVVTEYGQSQFGDLAVCAKSGTAEVGGGAEPHAWFAGFIDDPDHPWPRGPGGKRQRRGPGGRFRGRPSAGPGHRGVIPAKVSPNKKKQPQGMDGFPCLGCWTVWDVKTGAEEGDGVDHRLLVGVDGFHCGDDLVYLLGPAGDLHF